MKFLTGAIASGLFMAGIAVSATASAEMTCMTCYNHYQTCMAAGGSPDTCWTCNNNSCPPPAVNDKFGQALGNLSPKKSDQMAPADKKPAAALLNS
ncbi:hypothetical protein L2Y94_14905 [Luteibacter aegosomatis]|uniref:hypothetical protein n=1 Tax=Luteibacter aegosomatis TaxID=2911537 RepID=UPI001FFC0F8A|nr:hypothetical protein [Luteibacter aegosomatis]UPG84609.1 hypothetical protein L2Y94_14905 [Luteibacter aegosomatis]